MADVELQQLANIAGKRVCVLGSGDNQLVFALAGMGACVTSVDIAANQLAVARQRACELRLDIEFVQADVTDLAAITAGTFDVRKDEGSKNAGGNNVGSSNTGGSADASAIAVPPP